MFLHPTDWAAITALHHPSIRWREVVHKQDNKQVLELVFLDSLHGVTHSAHTSTHTQKWKTVAHTLTVLPCPLTLIPLWLMLLCLTHRHTHVHTKTAVFPRGINPLAHPHTVTMVFPQNAQLWDTPAVSLLPHTHTHTKNANMNVLGDTVLLIENVNKLPCRW